MEMSWKQRLVWSLPYVFVIGAAIGIELTEEIRFAIVALVGMWFLPSPLSQPNVSRETLAVEYRLHEGYCADCDPKNVSRETYDGPKDESIEEFRARINAAGNVSRETSSEDNDLPLPCHVMHGSADVHVLGCEGWRSPE